MKTAKVVADLRILLRHINKLPSSGSNGFKAHVLAQYRANIGASDPVEVETMREKARVVVRMLGDLKVRQELLHINAGEKMAQSERISLSAGRVGLNLPDIYDESSESEGEKPSASAQASPR